MAINESNTISYTVVTTNVADGTVIYWKTTGTVSNTDIVGGNTGSITIVNNQSTFNVTLAADETPDGQKNIGIQLLSSLGGTVLKTTADTITVNDTSTEPLVTYALYAWGDGYAGKLGLNSQISKSSPTQVNSGTNWTKLAGYAATFAINSDGQLWSWGSGQFGQNASNSTVYRSSPVQVGADTNWSKIYCQSASVGAIKTDGTLWVWGDNINNNLGLNLDASVDYGTARVSSPTQVGALTDWATAAIGAHSMAVKTNGTLWTLGGRNGVGQLGTNSTAVRSSPVQLGSLNNWSNVSTGKFHTTAVKTDGTLWAWGNNSSGELGINLTGFSSNKSSPVQVGAGTNWLKSIAGQYSTMAIKTDGTLWAWGENWSGKGGTNNTVVYSSPVQVGAGTTWLDFDTSDSHTAATKTDGTLWVWGQNSGGQLGIENTTYKSSPVQVGARTDWTTFAATNSATIGLVG